ncbi:MAG: hypothetical protein ACM3WU_00290 [Bacillota bacterium]
MLGSLERLDSRLVYLLLAISIVVPLLSPLGLPLGISVESRQVFDRIDRLPEGANVLLGYDYSSGGVAELEAGVKAILHHLAQKNARVVAIASTTEGPMFAEQTLKVYENRGKAYGTDYVNLGFVSGGESGLSALCRDVGQVLKTDFAGAGIGSLSLMSSIKTIKDFDLAISFNIGPVDGANTAAWVRVVRTEYAVPLILYVVTVMSPANMPYLQAKQIDGLLSGLRSGAEYEKLVEKPGSAVAGMDAQSISHLVIIGFITLGNLALYATRKAKGGAKK